MQIIKIEERRNYQLGLADLFPNTLAQRKKDFLHRLKSPSGKIKYKRYTGAPIRYAGGKSLAVGLVVERIPDNTKRVVSPFLGGGSVEVAITKELSYSMNKGRGEFGLVEICDVCGKPFWEGQNLGRKKSNNALCHEDCLYYESGEKFSRKKNPENVLF